MGRTSSQCCSCKIAKLAASLLVLALSTLVHATRLPSSEAQLPFVLSQALSAAAQHSFLQQGSPEESVATSSSLGRYRDNAIVRIDTNRLDDAQVTAILQQVVAAELDIWQTKKNAYIDIRVPPSFFNSNFYFANEAHITTTVPSLDELLKREADSQQLASSALSTQSHATLLNEPDNGLHSLYHSHASIESLLQLLSTDYPEFAKLESLGVSAEGRTIHALRVSDYRKKKPKTRASAESTWRTVSQKSLREMWASVPSLSKSKPKPKHKLGFALLGGQHAREWISPAVLLYIAHALVTTASKASATTLSSWTDEEQGIMTLLSDYELHFIPLANPDGYVYAWEHDRLWVRSRQYIGSNETRCHGIDLNRNWGYKWEKSYRPNPCSDLYPGSEAFESVENQVIKKYLEKVKEESRLDAFMDLHSFGQLIMYPYSYSCSAVPPDAENLFEALLRASKAIHSVHKQSYDVGGVCDVSYTATGQSLDWTYHDLRAKWSFAANLRDQGVYGFLLPPDQIVPAGQEMLAGLLDMARFIAQKERIED